MSPRKAAKDEKAETAEPNAAGQGTKADNSPSTKNVAPAATPQTPSTAVDPLDLLKKILQSLVCALHCHVLWCFKGAV